MDEHYYIYSRNYDLIIDAPTIAEVARIIGCSVQQASDGVDIKKLLGYEGYYVRTWKINKVYVPAL